MGAGEAVAGNLKVSDKVGLKASGCSQRGALSAMASGRFYRYLALHRIELWLAQSNGHIPAYWAWTGSASFQIFTVSAVQPRPASPGTATFPPAVSHRPCAGIGNSRGR